MGVVIGGAGAIGGVLGAWLARAGLDVLLVDRDQDHVAAIRHDGRLITGVRGEFTSGRRAALLDEVGPGRHGGPGCEVPADVRQACSEPQPRWARRSEQSGRYVQAIAALESHQHVRG